MNIKNIITKIFSLTLIFGVIFFATSFVYAACSPDMSTGSNSPYPNNTVSSGNCRSFAPNGNDRYNNQISFGDNAAIFLAMYNLQRAICDSSKVANIQTKMQELGGVCSTCIDGRAGTRTRNSIANQCLSLACPAPTRPALSVSSTGQLICDPGYILNPTTKCCELAPEPEECTTSIFAPDSHSGGNISIEFVFNGSGSYSEVGSFEIIGGIESSLFCEPENDDVVCNFTIIPFSSGSDIEIESPLGRITYDGDIQCPAVTKTITSSNGGDIFNCENNDVQKPLTGVNSDCISYGSGWIKDGTCCTKCDSAPEVGKTCEETHGTGWFEFGVCCDKCGSDETLEGGECVCGKNAADAPEGKKLNTESCERVCDPSQGCCGIKLNTVVPFIGDCIEMTTQNSTAGANGNSSYVNQLNAFPFLMMGLSKILVTVILIFSFLVIIAAGLMMVTGVYEEGNYSKGLERIKKIIVALILLGSSGLILKLINPTFFGG